MKKFIALLLALVMVLGLVACNKTPAEPTNGTNPATEPSTDGTEPASAGLPADATDDEIYDYILGEYYETYMEALESESISERFAMEAIAEAKMLESGIFLPNTSRGGNYAISRVVPNTGTSVLWGNDSDRYHDLLVTTELITAADRAEMKELWASSATADEYMTAVKALLTEKGYELTDVYNVINAGDPQTWDVLATYQQNDSEKIVHTFDGLMEYDQKNVLQPALAESYEVNDDYTVFTFHIRQGAKWVDSQGREIADVTANDFVSGMHHMMDAQGGLEYLVDGIIEGASEYMYGETTDFNDVGVKALDDYTVEYTLTEPCTYFMTMLAYGVFAPMNEQYFLSQGGAFGVDELAAAKESGNYTYGTSPDTIAYCGPYLITNWTEKNTITFKANETYWNADGINIHEINMLYNDGQDVTKAYTDAKAGTIAGAGLGAAAVEMAKNDGLFNDYAYVSATDATAFNAFFNVNRGAWANSNDPTMGISAQTDEQKELTHTAMLNVHFRRALCYSVDRAANNALRNGEELKLTNLINSYTPGVFVSLEEDVTVDINGTATTFPAGTKYGEIVQAQLVADGSAIVAYDPTADDGVGSSAGFDGWYNPEAAAAELAIAIEELKAQGVEISAENPVHLDYCCFDGSEMYRNQGNAFKQSVETVLGGVVIIDLVPYTTYDDYCYANYYPETGAEMNYDINTNTGWGPDYGDPKTYLDTLLPNPGGMAKSIGLF